MGYANDELKRTRDELTRRLSGVAFGFGTNAKDAVEAMEEFIDAVITAAIERREDY